MLRIYNAIRGAVNPVFVTISEGLLDNIPRSEIIEVDDIELADVILMHGVIDANGKVTTFVLNQSVDLSNVDKISGYINAFNNAHRIIYFDTLGPEINRDQSIYVDSGLRDTDVIISPATLPNRPNLYRDVWHISKAVFRDYSRYERVKGSVMISHDNIETNILNESSVLAEVMDVVSELHVTKASALSDTVKEALSKSLDKIDCQQLQYPKGIAYLASRCEFVLHTHTAWGVEMMGVEAGMTGCQPIYPDTEFYRDVFDGTGVLFYDKANSVESLKSIIEKGSTFTAKQVEAFRSKFSAEDTVPRFWNSVYDLYVPKKGK